MHIITHRSTLNSHDIKTIHMCHMTLSSKLCRRPQTSMIHRGLALPTKTPQTIF